MLTVTSLWFGVRDNPFDFCTLCDHMLYSFIDTNAIYRTLLSNFENAPQLIKVYFFSHCRIRGRMHLYSSANVKYVSY